MKRFLILGLTIRNVATIFEMVDWIFNIYTDLVSIFPFFRATFYARIGTERNKSITKSNVFEDRKSNKKSCLKRVNLEPSGTASKSQKSRYLYFINQERICRDWKKYAGVEVPWASDKAGAFEVFRLKLWWLEWICTIFKFRFWKLDWFARYNF